MANTTQAAADPVLKQIYKPKNYRSSTYKRRPMFALLPKSEDFGGRNQPVPNQYGNPQGVSSDFATAQTNASAVKWEDFLLTRVSMHGVAGIDGETVESTEKDKYAFVSALTVKIDSQMDSLLDALETYIPRDGNGGLGQIASAANVSSKTVALENTADAHNFEVGMTLVSATGIQGALNANTEVLAGVDRTNGTITATSATWDAVVTAIAAGDWLFRQGDAYANTSIKTISGFQSWIPATAPTSGDDHFGVDRSVDSRLYGSYSDQSNVSMTEALINGQSDAVGMGGAIDCYFINHLDYRRFKVELNNAEYYDQKARAPGGERDANVSFRGIRIDGDRGPIDVISANKCPKGTSFGMEIDTWELMSLGPVPKLNDRDGLTILRQANADGYEVRIVARLQLACRVPGYNVQVNLPA